MPLTFTERKEYLRDRLVNAAGMLRHGNFRLFWDSLVFEVNHVKNLLKMWWRSRRETLESADPGSASANKTKVLPASWRPTVYRSSPTMPPVDDATGLAAELARIKSKLRPLEDVERKAKWPKLRF